MSVHDPTVDIEEEGDHRVDTHEELEAAALDDGGPPDLDQGRPPVVANTQGPDDSIYRLATIIEQMMGNGKQQVTPSPREFKAPEFNGQDDVEYFLRQFAEVAQANRWDARSQTLHLRSALKEGARDCGKAEGFSGIAAALRARYGISPREARARLLSLKKEYRLGLQEHATEVSGLIELAYGDLTPSHRHELALEAFCNSLGNAYLQRHLLAVRATTLEQVVKAGNEFLQIRTIPGPGIRAIEAEPEEGITVQAVQAPVNPLEAILKAIQQLTTEVDHLKRVRRPPVDQPSKKVDNCWGCHKEGHVRAKCPTHPWPTKTSGSGNGESPQQ